MEYVNTLERLMILMSQKESSDQYGVRNALDRLITSQVDRVKINVMTHMLAAMDYFNGSN